MDDFPMFFPVVFVTTPVPGIRRKPCSLPIGGPWPASWKWPVRQARAREIIAMVAMVNHRKIIGKHRKNIGKWWFNEFNGIYWDVPSGNLTWHYGQSPFWMENIHYMSMAIFNIPMLVYQRVFDFSWLQYSFSRCWTLSWRVSLGDHG